MKRLQAVSVIFLIFNFFLPATEVDFRIAAFRPTSSFFRNMYGSVQPAYQLEIAEELCDHLQWWANLSFLKATGCSIPLHICTKLHMVPLSTGLKAVYHTSCVDFYAGLGIGVTWLQEKSTLNFFNSVRNVGGFFKQGIKFFYQCYTMSFFIDYQIQKFNSACTSCKIDASGFYFGGSIGKTF